MVCFCAVNHGQFAVIRWTLHGPYGTFFRTEKYANFWKFFCGKLWRGNVSGADSFSVTFSGEDIQATEEKFLTM